MKKNVMVIILILVVAISLSACDPSIFSIYKREYIEKIDYIELCVYNNSNCKTIDVSKATPKFDLQKKETVEILDPEKVEAFLSDFEGMTFFELNESVDEPTGYCLLWHLKDGNFLVFSSTYSESDRRAHGMAAEFDATGQFVRHIGSIDGRIFLENILDEYFTNYSL